MISQKRGRLFFVMSAFFSTIFASGAILANQTEQTSHAEEIIMSLDWKFGGSHQLPCSHSKIALPESRMALLGKDAREFHKLLEGKDSEIEAIVLDDQWENSVYFSSVKDGYVSLDDWKDINPKDLLVEIVKATELANSDRLKNGFNPLHVIGWIQEPILDRHTNTVYWAIEAESSSNQIVNSIAIRLGREGYERLNWVCSKKDYIPFGGELDLMLRSHSFDSGYRYSDYSKGDKVAAYGIGALIAATIGGKIVKAGGIILLFKKLGGFIVAGVAALFYKLRGIFRKRGDK